jgi:hypothetical protein
VHHFVEERFERGTIPVPQRMCGNTNQIDIPALHRPAHVHKKAMWSWHQPFRVRANIVRVVVNRDTERSSD